MLLNNNKTNNQVNKIKPNFLITISSLKLLLYKLVMIRKI